MSEAPLAPTCRHCGATNDSGASECWLCHRRDWRENPKIQSGHFPFRLRGRARTKFAGWLVALRTIAGWIVVIAMFWILVIASDGRPLLRIVGLTILILIAVIVAGAIALFSLCTAFW